MTYSVQSMSPGTGVRVGFYDSLREAMAAAYTGTPGAPISAVIFEGDTTEFDRGTIAAVFDSVTGWIPVAPRPAWWDDLTPEVRNWLLEHEGQDLPREVWIPVVQAGGSAASVSWATETSPGMKLGIGEDWIEFLNAVGPGGASPSARFE